MTELGNRILLVGPHWLGDVLFLTPALRAVRKSFPGAHLVCAVPGRCLELVRNNPHVNEVMEFSDELHLWRPARLAGIIGTLRKRQFDSVLFFDRSKTKAILVWMAGIKQRIGYEGGWRDRFLTRRVPAVAGPLHRTDYYLHLIQSLGIEPDGRTPDFFPAPDAAGHLERLLASKGIGPAEDYAVVHAGGNWELKRWPADYFVRWIRLFLERYPMPVLLCGTESERPVCESIATPLKKERVVSLCGETSLDTLALLLKRSRIFLTNDSGPIHLAASQGARIVALFGPTSPAITGPVSAAPSRVLHKDVGCEVPCYFRSCSGRVCMEWLTPEEAFAQTRELLE